MPIYEYRCAAHGTFDLMLPMSEAKESAPCPTCGVLGARHWGAPAVARTGAADADSIGDESRASREPPASRIENCTFKDNGQDIRISGGQRVVLKGNKFIRTKKR